MGILSFYAFICTLAAVATWYVTWYEHKNQKNQHSEEPNL